MEKLVVTRYIGSSVIIPMDVLNELKRIPASGITAEELLVKICQICRNEGICDIIPDDIRRRRSKYNTSSPEGVIKNLYGFLLYCPYNKKFREMGELFCFEDGTPRTRGALLHHIKTVVKLLAVINKDKEFKHIYQTIIKNLCL